MVQSWSVRGCAALCVLAMACVAGPVRNGSFGDKDDGWELPAGAVPIARVIDDDGLTDPSSLRFDFAEPAPTARVRQSVEVQRNTEYVLTAAFKTDGLHPVVRLDVPGPKERMAGSVRARSPDAGWHVRSARFNSGENTRCVLVIQAHTSETAPKGRAWVDDVDIVPAADFRTTRPVRGGYVGPAPGPNLALGRPYALNQEPNYGYSSDEGDAVQLTDGAYSLGYFWVQKSTVGWNRVSPVEITVDLGKDQPIAGASCSTAGGTAGVGFPSAILVLVSDDDETYFLAGELISASARHGLPDTGRYGVHRYVANDLASHGRYVRFVVVPGGMFCFCDEIEVYGGDPQLLGSTRDQRAPDAAALLAEWPTQNAVRVRLSKDLQTILARAAEAGLPDQTMAELRTRADALRREIAGVTVDDPRLFRAILPFNDLHRRIWGLNTTLFRANGLSGIVVWQSNRWDMLDPLVVPPAGTPPALRLDVMPDEFRAEAFNLTNAGREAVDVRLRFAGLPGSPRPPYLLPHEVLFAESQEKVVLAAALVPAAWTDGAYRFSVPAGMTRQVWLTCHVRDVAAGDYAGGVELEFGADREKVRLPLALHISTLRFPDQPTCSLGVWDYTDGKGTYGIKPGNRDAAIANMKAHFVDSPWAHPGTAPRAEPNQVDGSGHLLATLDFARFDAWVQDWEGARNYMVFLHVGDTFAGKHRNSAAFATAVGDWARAWAEHNRGLGLRPRQVAVLLVDEPGGGKADERIVAWAQAIRATTDEIVIWEDPCHLDPQKQADPALWEVCDVLCPNIGIYHRGGAAAAAFYESLRGEGKTLWFYVCSGGKLGDPYSYYRLQMWTCWKAGATGSGYWAFGDTGGADSEWNGYAAKGSSFSPVYIDETSVTDAKHWEGVREGIEDYEYLVMLRDRLRALREAGVRSDRIEAAGRLLREAPGRVVSGYDAGAMAWKTAKDRSIADSVRVEVLHALEELSRLQ